MGKLIAAINMTLDGFCDHTSIIPDDEMHTHYTDLLKSAGAIVYGRITYQLMEYWRDVVKNPTGNTSEDDFAMVMDEIPKVVFSRTLKSLDWDSATLAVNMLNEEVATLREKTDKDILIGSPGMIVAATQLGIIDEYQLCVHPVIAGSGLILFKDISDRKLLTLLKTKTFGSGAIVLYYAPVKQ